MVRACVLAIDRRTHIISFFTIRMVGGSSSRRRRRRRFRVMHARPCKGWGIIRRAIPTTTATTTTTILFLLLHSVAIKRRYFMGWWPPIPLERVMGNRRKAHIFFRIPASFSASLLRVSFVRTA